MKTSWRASDSSAKRSFRRSARASGRRRVAALAEHPLFAACTRPELRQIHRFGDEVDVSDGEVLLRRHRAGRWFVAVLSGTLRLERDGRTVATVGPGGHVGATTILGLGPQPDTVVAQGPCRLFVMGAQPLISVAHGVPGFRQGLFGTADPVAFRAELRRLRGEGDDAWRRLSPAIVEAARSEPEHLVWRPPRNRGAAVDWAAVLNPDSLQRSGAPRVGVPVPARALLLTAAFALVLTLVATLVLWHPPVAVLRPGGAIDAAADLRVEGAPTTPLNGRYVLTSVDVSRPTLAGVIVASLRGDDTVGVEPDGRDAATERRAGRMAFARSRRDATAAALALLERPGATVRFGRRPLMGPSAGLVYAVALVDLLSPEDLARGRTIAVTGEVDHEGRVLPVGNVDVKARVAEDAGADLFLVPDGQHPGPVGVPAVEVSSLKEAVKALRAT